MRKRMLFFMMLAMALPVMATPVAITSVDAGTNGSPPYNIASITVGTYTVDAANLRNGTSQIVTNFGDPSAPENADNLDLNSLVARHNLSGTDAEWTITNIAGQATYQDMNGDNPDFFLFEAGMNDSIDIQAILQGGVLGMSMNVASSTFGDTGLDIVGSLNTGQNIGGYAFSITDLLDGDGNALTAGTAIEGIKIVSSGIDPTSFSAVVPEPATLSLLALGGMLAMRRRK